MDQDDLKSRFTYHPPKDDQADRYQNIRAGGHWLASVIDTLCPDSREKSLAITKLQEAVMWANASIAVNE